MLRYIKYALAVILIVLIANYTIYSVFFPSSPTLEQGSEIAQLSEDELKIPFDIIELEPFAMGYALFYKHMANHDIWIHYHDFNHNPIWERNLNKSSFFSHEVTSSDKYISVFTKLGSEFWTSKQLINDTEVITKSPQYRTPSALIFDLNGDIVSNFSIQLMNATDEVMSDYSRMDTEGISWEIFGDTFFLLEKTDLLYLNSTSVSVFLLHSYNIISGELNWISEIDTIDNAIYWYPRSVQQKSLSANELSITISSKNNEILLNRYDINFEMGKIASNAVNKRIIGCSGDCDDDKILSFDTYVGYSTIALEDRTVHTFSSSNGYSLNVTVANWSAPGEDWIEGYDLYFYRYYNIDEQSYIILGTIRSDPKNYRNVMGFVSLSNGLDLILMDMNQTTVHNIRPVDNDRFLSINLDHTTWEYKVVLWSINRLEAIDKFYPLEKNIFPAMTVLSVIVYYASRGLKNIQSTIEGRKVHRENK